MPDVPDVPDSPAMIDLVDVHDAADRPMVSGRLTAMDIQGQQFARKVRGYDPDEVDLFLRSVAEEFERLSLEHGEMKEDVGRLERELSELRSREETLHRTLVTAQRMTDELRDRAEKEGELIVREARLRADKLLKDAQDRLGRLELDISRSRGERETFERQLRGILEQHQALLDMRNEAEDATGNVRPLSPRLARVGRDPSS